MINNKKNIISILIIISKICEIFYVIPFYLIIKDQGGTLYGYAYLIYSFFLTIFSLGLSGSVNKLMSECKDYRLREKVFKICKNIALVSGLIIFLLLILMAPLISKLIIGNLTDGISQKQLTFVIRIMSTSMIILPILNVYKGYLKDYKKINITLSNVINKIVTLLIIILGSLISTKLFHLSLEKTISISLLGLTIGLVISYLYLVNIYIKNKKKFGNKNKISKINKKLILKKIIIYALPFIIIDLFKTIYEFIDMVTVVKTISSMKAYSVIDAENIMGILTVWGNHFNVIVISISTFIIANNISKLNKENINRIILTLILFIIPIVVLFSILSKTIWFIFYGYNKFGYSIISYYIFVAFFISLYILCITILQIFKEYKTIIISLLVGIVLKILLNIPLMNSFNKMGLPPYYGSISSTIIGMFISIIICLYILYKKYKVNYELTLKEVINIFLGIVFMIVVIILLRLVLPYYTNSRLLNILLVIIYIFVGNLVYYFTIYKTKTVKHVLISDRK